jgi:hypothetical protein
VPDFFANLLNPGCCCQGGPYGGGDTGTIPGCNCTSIPTPLTMTSSDHSVNFGPPPAEWTGVLPDGFYSTGTFTEGFGGNEFYYRLTCSLNIFQLVPLYPDFGGGGPLAGSAIWEWNIVSTGNTCSPFALTNGHTPTGTFFGPVVVTILP